ncbi:MAG: SPOR domain-containing protein [Phycisphaerae bacterium]|nr:SPOR domain-containing protein [Saprospiraceae bacterium]
MKSNSLLTYVLYGLLGLFILAAGYYACQRQKEKKEQAAREAAELEETLRDMGYASEDTLAATGSSYTSKDSLAKQTTGTKPNATATKTTASKNGIENETASKTSTTKPSSTLVKPKSTVTKKGASSVKGPGTGRWAVRAGTFSYMEGARRRLEEVIQAGYQSAEISKTKEGKAAVIVFRSNDKDAAIRIVDKLEERGIDAAVFDRTN